MNIYLIGYRCTGKTSIAKLLAQQTGRKFVDVDDEIVKTSGQSIKSIVESQGWEAFREKERLMTRELCRQGNLVIATGGGVVLDTRNVDAMKKSGKLVWLKARPETIRKRIQADERTDTFRPSLSDQGVLEEIEAILTERNPLYRSAMDFSIDTDDTHVDKICRMITAHLQTGHISYR